MITFLLLLIISIAVLGIAFALISAGGAIFLVFAADIIVAVFVMWLIYKFVKKKK